MILILRFRLNSSGDLPAPKEVPKEIPEQKLKQKQIKQIKQEVTQEVEQKLKQKQEQKLKQRIKLNTKLKQKQEQVQVQVRRYKPFTPVKISGVARAVLDVCSCGLRLCMFMFFLCGELWAESGSTSNEEEFESRYVNSVDNYEMWSFSNARKTQNSRESHAMLRNSHGMPSKLGISDENTHEHQGTKWRQDMHTSAFFRERERGWFWYELPKKEPLEPFESLEPDNEEFEPEFDSNINTNTYSNPEPKPEPELEPKPNPNPGVRLVNGRYELEDMALVKSAWLRMMIPKTLELAIDSGNANDVYNYFFLQRLAMDKSESFERTAQRVMIGASNLDEMPGNNLSMEARLIKSQSEAVSRDEALRMAASRNGLVFYYKGSCRYCHLAAESISRFAELGFRVIAVSLDGVSIPQIGAQRYEFQAHPPVALGIEAVPAVVMIRPKHKPVVLSTGLISHSELSARVLEADKLFSEQAELK